MLQLLERKQVCPFYWYDTQGQCIWTYLFIPSFPLPDSVGPAQRQILRRARGVVLHHLLHPGVPAAPDVHPWPQAVWKQRAEHRRPGGHPAALPADAPGVLLGRGRAAALGGHWDGGTRGKGKTGAGGTDDDDDDDIIHFTGLTHSLVLLLWFFLPVAGSGSEDHASDENLQDLEAGASLDRPQSLRLHTEAVLPAGLTVWI